MNLKQKAIALIAVLASTTAVTTIAMPQVTVSPSRHGAWVQVQKNGRPVADALVNENFITDSAGRVFVYNNRIASSANFFVVTPDGETVHTRAFIGADKERR